MGKFLESIKMSFFDKYFEFEGRASRYEYWSFFLFQIIVGVVLSVIGVDALITIASIVFFIPSLMITFRRLRDAGRSLWWIMLPIIPVVGGIILLIMLMMPSED